MITVSELAKARGIPPGLLSGLGWSDGHNGSVEIPWPVTAGPPATHLRHSLDQSNGRRWSWRSHDRGTLLPYGADRLGDMLRMDQRNLIIVESEADAVAIWHAAKLPAIATGGADCWQPRWWEPISGFGEVVVWVEDVGGLRLLQSVLASRPPGGPAVAAAHALDRPEGKDAGRIAAAAGDQAGSIIANLVAQAVRVAVVDDLLASIVERLDARRSGDGWSARCPLHDDEAPSLSIFSGDGGRWAFRCHGGNCGVKGPLALLGVVLGLTEPSQPSRPHKDRDGWDEDPPASRGAGRRSSLPVLTLPDLWAQFDGRVNWLVPGYLARGELVILPGPPESLKSWAMVDLARAVGTGSPWLGALDVGATGPAIYLEGERAGNLAHQTRLLTAGTGADLSGLIVVPPCGFTLGDRQRCDELAELVRNRQPVLMVINSFRSVFTGNPIDGVEVAKALGWLGHLADETKATIVLIDQVNKPGATGRVRGMAAHADSLQKAYEADAVLHIERGRDAVGRGTGPATIFVGKRRQGDAGPPFRFEVQPAGDGVVVRHLGAADPPERSAPPTAATAITAILGDVTTPMTAAELAEQTGISEKTIRNTLSRLNHEGKVVQSSRGRWQATEH